jgi:hypothetical protein
MKTAVSTATATTLTVSDIDSTAIHSFRFMGTEKVGTLEVSFQSGAVYRYHEVPYITVLTMAMWVESPNLSVGHYFAVNIRTNYAYDLIG